MLPLVAIDLTCLLLAPMSPRPRGIDRVEYAYAKHYLLNWPGDCVAVIPTAWGVRFYERGRAARGLGIVDTLWKENIGIEEDETYCAARAALMGGGLIRKSEMRSTMGWLDQAAGFWKLFSETGIALGRSCKHSLPSGAVYLNVGQLEVSGLFFNWLKKRPDIISAFMVHDAIPIEFSSYHSPAGVRLHKRILRNIQGVADALIFPSNSAQGSVLRYLPTPLTKGLATRVELLPVPDPFLTKPPDDKALAGSYFIACGALDAHKNHLILLKVWRRLAALKGSECPKLIIAGTLGATSGPILEFLKAHPELQQHVLICSGLSTPGLRQLVSQATALLAPSLTEGFGLPVVEALAQGTPVLASDIKAHREAATGGDVIFIDPIDDDAWLAQILADRKPPLGYSPKTWHDYFAAIDFFLSELVTQKRNSLINWA